MPQMNSLTGKQILSLVRNGNYAHAGEEEAILRTFDPIPKDPNRIVLDVGCGIGGTADFVQRYGWGQVTGIDLDSETIEHAKELYPEIVFHACDILDISETIVDKADIIYLFNSFYAFDHQNQALSTMRKVAKDNANLIIFDYVNRGSYQDAGRSKNNHPTLPHPIELEILPDMLQKADWNLIKVEDIDNEYERWYEELVKKISEKRDEITKIAGSEWFDYVQELYTNLLNEIKQGTLGGVIVRAIS